jgi:RecA/RadA recombinase
MPLGVLYELYGPPGLGKSTLGIFLSARVKLDGLVVMADVEGSIRDADYLRSVLVGAGFKGTFRLLPLADDKGKPLLHEDVLQSAIDALWEDASAGILDSVGMFTPAAEAKGDVADAIVGRKAKVITNATRRIIARLRDMSGSAFFVINHQLALIGSQGFYTPGGDGLKYGAGVRMRLFQKESGLPEGGIVTEAIVTKLRYGGTRKESRIYICLIPNFGISPDLSVMFEAISEKKATREEVVKIGNKSMGRIGKLFEKALERDRETFIPFYEVMGYQDYLEVE